MSARPDPFRPAMPERAPAPGRRLARMLEGPEATDRLGARLGTALAAGDVVALEGGLGAGKSALARAAIRARLGDPALEVPSPTYTLVNVYDDPAGGAPVWHADLYRLAGLDEVAELGLDEAFATAVTLIEWPGRVAPILPPRRLTLALEIAGDTRRHLAARMDGPGWEAVAMALEATP
ncbi:MAG: tRNA (adenosine(37)-N6)-threonylcarbamoyltransferase complex ATPase subunit type 1 TsaE [Pseudomonadota bacterium]